MSTGYTYGIREGTIKTFRQFAFTCARAFGALIHMRDEPLTAELPDAVEPGEYHARIVELEEERARVTTMTEEEVEAIAEANYRMVVRLRKERWEKSCDLELKYRDMLSRAKDWEPPTADHVKLQAFMVKQLEWSIEFDCSTPEQFGKYYPSPERDSAWRKTRLAVIDHRIREWREMDEKERQCAQERTRWIQALKESIPEEGL